MEIWYLRASENIGNHANTSSSPACVYLTLLDANFQLIPSTKNISLFHANKIQWSGKRKIWILIQACSWCVSCFGCIKKGFLSALACRKHRIYFKVSISSGLDFNSRKSSLCGRQEIGFFAVLRIKLWGLQNYLETKKKTLPDTSLTCGKPVHYFPT